MLYADIIQQAYKKKLLENYDEDMKRVLRDILVFLKMNKVEQITPEQIVVDFHNRGLDVSTDEVVNLLKDDPLVSMANDNSITFSKPQSEENQELDLEKHDDDAKEISRMSTKAVDKSMNESTIKKRFNVIATTPSGNVHFNGWYNTKESADSSIKKKEKKMAASNLTWKITDTKKGSK